MIDDARHIPGRGREGRSPVVPVLRGPRVVLRPVTQADRPRLLQILAEPDVERWWRRTEWERVLEPAATSLAIELDPVADGRDASRGRHVAPGRSAASRARLVRTVGLIQFSEEPDEDYRSAGIDLFLTGEVHGQGLGSEAIRVLVRHLIDRRGHHRFVIDPATENEGAVRCYRKVGFRPVGVLRRYERVAPGVYRDGLLMELLADELVE